MSRAEVVGIGFLAAIAFYTWVCVATLAGEDVPLWARRASVPVALVLAPDYSRCEHCGLPWKFVETHSIMFRCEGMATAHVELGVFVVCEACWKIVPEADMVRYAMKLGIRSGMDPAELKAIHESTLLALSQRAKP